MESAAKVMSAPFYKEDDIYTEHLSVSAPYFGEETLLQLLNNSIQNEGYEVKFSFRNVIDALNADDYRDLVLAYHVVKMPRKELIGINIFEVMDVFDIYGLHLCNGSDLSTTGIQLFEFSLGEDIRADSVSQIIFNLNHVLIPAVEQKLAKLNIQNFKVTFNISKGY